MSEDQGQTPAEPSGPFEIEVCFTCGWKVDEFGECGCEADASSQSGLVEVVPRAVAEALAQALEPFVRAYEATGRTYCPDFSGPRDLSWFYDALTALNVYRSAYPLEHSPEADENGETT